MLASNINLLTHYAKGTLLFGNKPLFELLIKLLFQVFPHGTMLYRLYIIFRLRGRFPYLQTKFILLIMSSTMFIHTTNSISFDLCS
jgi:hypothetical protein